MIKESIMSAAIKQVETLLSDITDEQMSELGLCKKHFHRSL